MRATWKIDRPHVVKGDEIHFFRTKDANKDVLIAPLQFQENDVLEKVQCLC